MFVLEINEIDKDGNAENYEFKEFNSLEEIDFEIKYIKEKLIYKYNKNYAFTIYDVKNDKLLKDFIMNNNEAFNELDDDQYAELLDAMNAAIISSERTLEI